ncbi:hypothetical protein Ancab_021066 [Ancistrocladus abbreviatus]
MDVNEEMSCPEIQVRQIFSEFLRKVVKFEELATDGRKFLSGFQQGLAFLRRPPINTSELILNIIKANETERVKSYVQGGCMNTTDSIEKISELNTFLHRLQEHSSKAKQLLAELESLMDTTGRAMQSMNSSSDSLEQDIDLGLDQGTLASQEEILLPSKDLDVADYASLMAVMCCMVKQDFMMQEKIISSLNLQTSTEELESYCLMWSLRPFINDDIIHLAMGYM